MIPTPTITPTITSAMGRRPSKTGDDQLVTAVRKVEGSGIVTNVSINLLISFCQIEKREGWKVFRLYRFAPKLVKA